ncbi:MAG TPA: PilN domain-containing protein [Nitrospirota bacterium]|nr:PilN domain-containing protein [Nitrospirota bacterium]
MKTAKEYINLLPTNKKKPALTSGPWLVAGTLFVLVWLVLFGLKAKQWIDLQARLDSLMPQKQFLEQQAAALRAELGLTTAAGGTSEQAALIQSLLKERVLWSEVFQQFSRIIPRGIWFDSLEGSSVGEAEIKIRGGALTYRLISDFMLAMEQTGYFEKPELVFAQKSILQGRDIVGFEIHCGVKKSRGVP